MSKLRTYANEFGPILIPLLVFSALNHVFNTELSLLAQPVYGYSFSGRLISVIQLSFSVAFNYKPVPPAPLLQQAFFYVFQLDVRVIVLLLWFSIGFLFMLASGNPRGVFQSSSPLLFFMVSILLWGLSTRHPYAWFLLTVFQANPLLTCVAGYVLIVLTLGLSAYISEILLNLRRRVEPVEEQTVRVSCPRCNAEFRSNPVYCSFCGFRIKNTEN
ncbi:MAG: hypothetical protein QXN15_09530 [Candidatus Jordarchaeales archaeon]|nr:hypothetical protein [Candidatus Jordarchaeia archaeon]